MNSFDADGFGKKAKQVKFESVGYLTRFWVDRIFSIVLELNRLVLLSYVLKTNFMFRKKVVKRRI